MIQCSSHSTISLGQDVKKLITPYSKSMLFSPDKCIVLQTVPSVWSEIVTFVDKSFEVMFTFHTFKNIKISHKQYPHTERVIKKWQLNVHLNNIYIQNVYKTFRPFKILRTCWRIEKNHTIIIESIDTAHSL